MRHAILRGIAALLATSVAAAQGPTPANPGTAPAAPKGPRRAEFRVGGFMLNGERSYDFADSVRNGGGSIRSVEVLMRAPAIGLMIRSMSGDFKLKPSGSQPKVISADARLLLFPPTFTIFAGAGRRVLSSKLADRQFNIVMAGFSSTINIGGTGLRTHVSAAVLRGQDIASKTTGVAAIKETSPGMEGEAAVYYRLPKIPFFVSLGYRTETFTATSKANNVLYKFPEEVRGLRIGAGLQFGGH